MGSKKNQCRSAWVDSQNKIVSFLPQSGFQQIRFPTHQEMFQYVIHLGFAGYGIL